MRLGSRKLRGMKLGSMGLGSIAILMAVLAMPVQAQRLGDRQSVRGDRDDRADLILRLRERLELSEDQIARLRDAQVADRETRDALRLETRALRDQLRDQEITREEFRLEMEGRRGRVADGMTTYRESLEGILTDEQRSQMRQLRRQTNRDRASRAQRGARAQRGGRALRARPGAIRGLGRRRSLR